MSVTRSATESKKAPRGDAVPEALATAPSSRSGRAERPSRTMPRKSRPVPMATADATAMTRPAAVRWSAFMPACRGSRRLAASPSRRPRASPCRTSQLVTLPGGAGRLDDPPNGSRPLAREGAREELPACQDPQRRARRPRRHREDDAGRGPAPPRRGHQPPWAGSRTAPPPPTSTPKRYERGISLVPGAGPVRARGLQDQPLDTPGYADFVADVGSRPAGRRPRGVRGERGRGRRGPDRGRLANGRRAGPAPHDLRQQARPGAGQLRPHARRSSATRFGAGVAPLELPIGEEAEFRGIADLLTDTAHFYDAAQATIGEIPDEHGGPRARGTRQPGRGHRRGRRRPDRALPRGRGHQPQGARGAPSPRAWPRPSVFPVTCGSAAKLIGIDRLAQFICEIGPSPLDRPAGHRAGRRRHHGRRARPGRPAAGLRLQDPRRPLRRQGLALQGAVRHGPARRRPDQLADPRRRAAARPVHPAGQGAGPGAATSRPATSGRWPS